MKLFLYTLLCPLWATAVIIRDYNMVNYKEYGTFQEFADVHLNGDKDTFNQNVFVGTSTQECRDKLESPAFRGAQRNGGGNVVASVSLPSSEFPMKLSEDQCAEIFFYRIGDKISNPASRTNIFDHSELNKWGANLMRVRDAEFVSNFPYPIKLFWHEESTDPVSNGIVEPGHAFRLDTFLGHVFSAHRVDYDEGEAEEAPEGEGYKNIVDFMVVNGAKYEFSPLNRLETCEVVPGTATMFAADNQTIDCSDMRVRLIEFTHNVWHEKRLGLNYVQPQLVRAVTHNGFEHRRLPEATYKWLKEWYYREQLSEEVVEGGAGPCMNQHVAPTDVTHLTPANKDRLSREMRSILEDWYGGELYLTSIYGIRKYNNGSVLRMHVDTVDTHVVSAIINVDQEVDEDWPLLILDHNDQEHNIVMKAGDMVLYESAKLLHGRPEVFKGKHYDNIFIHYKPISGWDYSWL